MAMVAGASLFHPLIANLVVAAFDRGPRDPEAQFLAIRPLGIFIKGVVEGRQEYLLRVRRQVLVDAGRQILD